MSKQTDLAKQNPQRALVGYDEDEIQRFAEIVKRVAPWANSKKHPMSNQEIGLAVRRALGMGLDPLNTHEVQIWKDRRGSINFQIAYTLRIEWVRRFKGGHTEPQYFRLTEQQKLSEGVAPEDVVYRVEFIMIDDLDKMREMLQLEVFDPHEVKAMFTVTGLGTAHEKEYNNEYFAPNARSKSWKVKKRALTDAYRRKFGTPSRAEIEELRRAGVLSSDPVSYRDEKDTAMIADSPDRGRNKVFLSEDPRAPRQEDVGDPPVVQNDEDVIEGEYEEVAPDLRYPPDKLRAVIGRGIKDKEAGFTYEDKDTANKKRFAVVANFEEILGDKTKRHQLSWFLTGKKSSSDWEDAAIETLRRWLHITKSDSGEWSADPMATAEAKAAWKEAIKVLGQQELDLN